MTISRSKSSDFLDGTSPVREGEELDLGRLEPYLRSRLPEPTGPLVVEQFPRGHSNLTYLVRIGERELALRRPPFGSKVKTAHDMGREYRVLAKLHQAYHVAPQALFYCDDPVVIGAPFYVMERLTGIILRRDAPTGLEIHPDAARRLSESFIDSLAVLHGLDYRAIGLGDLGKPQGYVERQVKGWIERYSRAQTDDLPEIEKIAPWLTEQIPSETGAALIHNDYKYDNAVLDPNEITRIVGVLDWEMCTVGDPLMDLGTTLSYWTEPDDNEDLQRIRMGPTTLPGTLRRVELAQRWAERTGSDISNLAFYYAFGLFKTAVIGQQIYYRYHQGLTEDQRFASFIEMTKALLRAGVRVAETGRV